MVVNQELPVKANSLAVLLIAIFCICCLIVVTLEQFLKRGFIYIGVSVLNRHTSLLNAVYKIIIEINVFLFLKNL